MQNGDFTAESRMAAPPWKTCLDIENQSADHYRDYWNAPLLDLVRERPRKVLELGCGGGMLGAKLKERYPGASVTGIDANPAAARLAAGRLDRVIVSRLESLDLEAEGLAGEQFDHAFAADILEHLVNPWGFLVRLRACLAPRAWVLASIPNVRNLRLIAELLEGHWRYAERGLLDVTHLRFFTFEGVKSLFEETGYSVESVGVNLSASLVDLYTLNREQATLGLQLGRLRLDNVTSKELQELCAEQFLVLARVA